jgi:hypothetical protein
LNSLDERPYPLDLIARMNQQKIEIQASYLLVQSDNVIVQHQHLPSQSQLEQDVAILITPYSACDWPSNIRPRSSCMVA